MAQDIVEQLQRLCTQLRDQLMQQPEYRALMSLEKALADVEGYFGHAPSRTEQQTRAQETIDPETITMSQGMDHMADMLADALRETKPGARPADHLPSHRVA